MTRFLKCLQKNRTGRTFGEEARAHALGDDAVLRLDVDAPARPLSVHDGACVGFLCEEVCEGAAHERSAM